MSFLKSMRTPFAAALLALATLAAMPVAAQAQASAPAADTAAAPAASDAAAPSPAPDMPPATAGAPVTKETIENPYGLSALWRDGGWIAKFNLVIMLIMSMGSWYIIFTKFWEQHKMLQSSQGVT